MLRVWQESTALQARWLVARQQQGQGSAAARAIRSGQGQRLLDEVVCLLPPSFYLTKDLLDALLHAARDGATDDVAALLLYFRTALDEAGRLKLRRAAKKWCTRTGNTECLGSLECLDAARSAGRDINSGIWPDGSQLLSSNDRGPSAECVALLLATEPALNPNVGRADKRSTDRCRTGLHFAAREGKTAALKTILAAPGGEGRGEPVHTRTQLHTKVVGEDASLAQGTVLKRVSNTPGSGAQV